MISLTALGAEDGTTLRTYRENLQRVLSECKFFLGPHFGAESAVIGALFRRAKDAVARGDFDLAQLIAEQIVGTQPNNEKAHSFLGLLFFKQREYFEAVRAFQAAARIEGDRFSEKFKIPLAFSLIETRQLDEAQIIASELVGLPFYKEVGLLISAVVKLKTGDVGQAYELANRVIQNESLSLAKVSHPYVMRGARNVLVEARISAQRFDDAERILLAESGGSSHPELALARVHWARNSPRRALELLNRYLDGQPRKGAADDFERQIALWMKAGLQFSVGDRAKSLETLTSLANIDIAKNARVEVAAALLFVSCGGPDAVGLERVLRRALKPQQFLEASNLAGKFPWAGLAQKEENGDGSVRYYPNKIWTGQFSSPVDRLAVTVAIHTGLD